MAYYKISASKTQKSPLFNESEISAIATPKDTNDLINIYLTFEPKSLLPCLIEYGIKAKSFPAKKTFIPLIGITSEGVSFNNHIPSKELPFITLPNEQLPILLGLLVQNGLSDVAQDIATAENTYVAGFTELASIKRGVGKSIPIYTINDSKTESHEVVSLATHKIANIVSGQFPPDKIRLSFLSEPKEDIVTYLKQYGVDAQIEEAVMRDGSRYNKGVRSRDEKVVNNSLYNSDVLITKAVLPIVLGLLARNGLTEERVQAIAVSEGVNIASQAELAAIERGTSSFGDKAGKKTGGFSIG
jgi:hypothetical protein